MHGEMHKRALVTRDAYHALLELKQLVDEAAQSTHVAELEAVHLAITPRAFGDITPTSRRVLERLGSARFESTLSRARESLRTAAS